MANMFGDFIGLRLGEDGRETMEGKVDFMARKKQAFHPAASFLSPDLILHFSSGKALRCWEDCTKFLAKILVIQYFFLWERALTTRLYFQRAFFRYPSSLFPKYA